MKKTYQLQRLQNYARIILDNPNGDKATFDFAGGNVVEGLRPQMTLVGKYYQDLLENSELYRNKTIILLRSEKTAEDYAAEAADKAAEADKLAKEKATLDELENVGNCEKSEDKVEEKSTIVITDVTTPQELIAFVNEKLGVRVKTLRTALSTARDKGYEFPNLKEN